MVRLAAERRALHRWITERYAVETQVPGPLRIFGLTHFDTVTSRSIEIVSVVDRSPLWGRHEALTDHFLAHAWLRACLVGGSQRFALAAVYVKPGQGGGRERLRHVFQLEGVDMPRRQYTEVPCRP